VRVRPDCNKGLGKGTPKDWDVRGKKKSRGGWVQTKQTQHPLYVEHKKNRRKKKSKPRKGKVMGWRYQQKKKGPGGEKLNC